MTVTREDARIANADLRAEMRERGNYFAEVEAIAAAAVAKVGYNGVGALSEANLRDLAADTALVVTQHAGLAVE